MRPSKRYNLCVSFSRKGEKRICMKTTMNKIIEERLKLFENIIKLREEGIYKLTYAYTASFSKNFKVPRLNEIYRASLC